MTLILSICVREITQNLTQNFTHIEKEQVEEIIVNHLLTEKSGRVSLKVNVFLNGAYGSSEALGGPQK